MKNCPICGGRLEPVSEEREVRVGNRTARVLDEHARCTVCAEELYAPGQMDATLRRASDVIRRDAGLLLSDEIRGIRERLALSQRAFEELLGVGPKTVVRWEKGTVFQNRATDSLLRVVGEYPEVARFLADLHGVELPAGQPSLRG
jgi:HTH-type transcriptional regulator/antitoxin MqsA